MDIETLTSRKNAIITHLRALASDGAYRREQGEYLCDGMKLLQEAVSSGAEIRTVLWCGERPDMAIPENVRHYAAPRDLFDYVSPMKNSPGPVFTVSLPACDTGRPFRRAVVLENVQDPGNVGTVIRTAAAFEVDAVILCGACADVFSPKVVRASMGAIFRQRILYADVSELRSLAEANSLALYAAALSDTAADVRSLDLKRAIVAIGSEGQGLSRELLNVCSGQLIIPMAPDSESLNAAVAASVVMWEMRR